MPKLYIIYSHCEFKGVLNFFKRYPQTIYTVIVKKEISHFLMTSANEIDSEIKQDAIYLKYVYYVLLKYTFPSSSNRDKFLLFNP